MFVNAPRPKGNGALYNEGTLLYRKSAARPRTFEEAMSSLEILTDSMKYAVSYASRDNMQKGITGFGQYKNTPYTATMESQKVTGANRMVSRYYSGPSTQYETIVAPLVFVDSGGIDLTSLTPQPHRFYFNVGYQSNHPTALYNRSVIQNTVNRAQAEARLRAASQEIDLSETLVDLDTSVLMVADATMRVLRSLRSVRKGHWDAALRYLGIDRRKPPKFKDAANAWLALQYGWLPLLNDIYSGFNAVKLILDPVANPHQMHATRRLNEQLLMPNWNVPGTSETLKNEAFCSVETKFRFSVSDPFWALMGQLGLTNPASMAWAALPYSFVVDWLLPVGTMLGALSAPVGLKFQTGYTTTRAWGDVEIRRTLLPQYGTVEHNDGVSRVQHSAAMINREVHYTWPTVLPYVRFPFSNPTRLLNAAALLETSHRKG
jgi:hypothetical protein